jgi:hypothetical protein
VRRAFAAASALLALILLTGGGSLPARGDAPADLQVFEAESTASPIGVISRVPAETDGGVIFARSHVEIGKSIAQAAGTTLGPLGDAFVVTSLKGFNNPTNVTAQYPPSSVFPSTANASTNVNAGAAQAATFHAVTDSTPSASANAIGGAGGMTNVLHVGGVTSQSTSHVDANGTVVTTATSSLSDVRIPENLPLISISNMKSTATVTVPLGGKPQQTVQVSTAGALIAGVPVSITQDGISLAGRLAVPAVGITAINTALASLNKLGIDLQVVPVTRQSTDIGASVSGAALRIGYQLPASIPLPTSIGSSETILLGQVTATATGRKRVPLDLGGLPGDSSATPNLPLPSASTTDVALPPTGAAEPATAGLSSSLAGNGAGTASPAVAAAPITRSPAAIADSPFQLPKRVKNAAAGKFLAGYRMFIIVAVLGVAAFLIRRQTRLAS